MRKIPILLVSIAACLLISTTTVAEAEEFSSAPAAVENLSTSMLSTLSIQHEQTVTTLAQTAENERKAAEEALAQEQAQAQYQAATQAYTQSETTEYIGDKLQFIIDRESGGDPYAENGQYKGIGQLQESYYQNYIGKSWSEVAGDESAQIEAMNAYIESRYGSVEGAYEHTINYGWY